MYAITGITGQVGGALARHLLDAGKPVRAVVRDAEKGKVWLSRGCELAIAAMDDASALKAAFMGAQGVFILLPPVFDPAPDFAEARTYIDAIAPALQAARPERVVCLSTIGAQASEPNLLTQLGMLEHALVDLPMPVAYLRAGWFMENSAWDVTAARDTGVIDSYLAPLERAIPMVATEDVGRVAAELLQQSWQGRRVVQLEGPERIAPLDIAAAFSRILTRQVEAHAVPRDSWAQRFAAQGMNNPGPRMRMLDGFNEGWIALEVETIKGRVDLETVLRGLAQRV
ncbi:MAG: NmrA family NAD(P)-binding protein [Burkholderiaceae bacterium]|nr:NmrA family NAD(P)-binding protein [Burkholderiaceae bacterium]